MASNRQPAPTRDDDDFAQHQQYTADTRVGRAPKPRRHDESDALRAIRLALCSIHGVVVWRNNVGVDPMRGVRYGLCRGSADLIGIATRADGVGVFVAIEVKSSTGKTTPEQDLFLQLVRSRGGIATVCRSASEAVTYVRQAIAIAARP